MLKTEEMQKKPGQLVVLRHGGLRLKAKGGETHIVRE
jgi:hypothetical protein